MTSSHQKANPNGFVMTGRFPKNKVESLLKLHSKLCSASKMSQHPRCKDITCEEVISSSASGDYLIVGSVLSQEY